MKKEPNLLLKKALKYAETHGKALDIGCGLGSDSIHLSKNKFDVTAVDINSNYIKELQNKKYNNITAVNADISDLELISNTYSIVNAQWVLPFIKTDKIGKTLKNINNSLKNDGVFCGQFFGRKDQWYFDLKVKSKINFITKREFTELLSDYFIIYSSELYYLANSINQKNKRWHVYEFIVSKTNVLQKNTRNV